MKRHVAGASCAYVAASCLVLLGQARTQQPTFRTGVQVVRIDVSVLDDKRLPVRGLQASDFTVLEDGQPRPIRSFQAVDNAAAQTKSIATMAPVPAHEVATNRVGDDTSRLIFILLDRSIPPERPMLVARRIAEAAVDAMAPGDLAAIVTTGGGVPQNLTSDRARLHKTIAASDWSQGLSQAQKDDPIVGGRLNMGDVLGDPRCMCGLCVLDTIARIANDVRDVPRRKVLLFIGSDLIVQAGPREFSQDVGCEKRVRDSRERLFDALGTSGLTVHSIDPNGVASIGPATRATVVNGVENRDGAALLQQLTKERNDFMAAQGNLAVLPELTGGRTILNSNEPFRMIPDVLRESDAYYLLAFEPIESTGTVRHDVQVKVSRKGAQVHSARYIAPTLAGADPRITQPAPPLERALTGLLSDSSLPLEMSVASFAGSDPKRASVFVTLNASAFASGPGTVPLEIELLASDERGRPVASGKQNATAQVPASAGGARTPAELQTFLTLPPGDYELRAAVLNAGTQAASSVFAHVTIPSFDAADLSLSDVVLGTRENRGTPSDGAPSIGIVPTTARVFSANAPAWAFLRVYRPVATRDASPVSIDMTVVDTAGKRVRHVSQSLKFADRTADVRLALPVSTLPTGDYFLRIDAKQDRGAASRSIAFAVARSAPAMTEEHSPELDAALEAVSRYVEDYEHRISAVGAEEQYEQGVSSSGSTIVTGGPRSLPVGRGALATGPSTSLTRQTRANIMTISLGPQGWVSFRDVFELDGHPVGNHVDRLSRILQTVNPGSLEQARLIADESARYNLDPEGTHVDRTINVPMAALHFVRAANQPRSVFTLAKPERVGGVVCTTLHFTEQNHPRLVQTKDDAPAQGTLWIDMANGGRVVKTELRMESVIGPGQSVRAQSAVTYKRIDKLDLWLPVAMDDNYELTGTRQTVTGHATYSDFREFKVTTSADIK